MVILLFVIHVLIALALVGVVLLQKSEGGALGMGGGGMSGFMTGRSTANVLTRTTMILAVLFFVTSLALVLVSNSGRDRPCPLRPGRRRRRFPPLPLRRPNQARRWRGDGSHRASRTSARESPTDRRAEAGGRS
jgi:protein translocase SecG subunit